MSALLSIVRNLLLLANLLCVFAFLISCLAPFISPATFWPVAFAGFGFMPLLFANVAWIFFWLLFKMRYAVFSLLAVLLSWWNISNHFNLSGCVSQSQGVYSIMTFNVKVFNLYDWTHNEQSKNAILQLISNANPDILCMQEFYTDDSEAKNTVALLSQIYPYYHFHKTLTNDVRYHWGIATFSKFPIVDREAMIFKDVKHNLAIFSDIPIGSDTLRIFNAHLQSIYLGPEEFEGMKHLQTKSEAEFIFWRLFNKLHDGFIRRTSQAEILAEEISASPHKVLVCADFNDTPNSYTYRTVSEGLTDSFREHGCLMGRTYSKPAAFRIDYILADKRIELLSHQVIWNNESDHYAVKASFNIE